MASTCKWGHTAARELSDQAGAGDHPQVFVSSSIKSGESYLPFLKSVVKFFEKSCARGHYLFSEYVYGNF